jgi:hypothetical protein
LNNKGISGRLNCLKFLFSLNHLVVSEILPTKGQDMAITKETVRTLIKEGQEAFAKIFVAKIFA